MKKVLGITMISLMLAASSVNAQKIGHINSQELLLAMPERAQAEKDVQAYAKQLESQLTAMSEEYKTKVADYQSKEATMTETIKKTKVKEITDLETRIKEFQETAQTDLQNKEGELLKPLIEKAKKAIEDVGKENGYTYVLDASQGTLLVKPDGSDIMPLVKKKMGITK